MTPFTFEVPMEQMSKSQQKIADYILKKAEQIPFYTEEDIATGAGVSISTVSRFWQMVGYTNLKAFKRHLHEAQYATPAIKMQHMLHHSPASLVGEMLDSASSYLIETKDRLYAESYEEAVQALHKAKHIYVHAPGSAACLAELFAFRMNRIGITVQKFAESGHAIHEKLVLIGEEDVVLCFGFVRTSPELAVILDYASVACYTTILITDLLAAEMLDRSDIVLQVERGEREAFHSLVAPMVLVDSLAISVTAERGEDAIQKLQHLHQLRKQYSSILPK